jgi:hypothetical protein
MIGFTDKQKNFILKRDIKVGKSYSFPELEFRVSQELPDIEKIEDMETVNTNPFTKSLSGQYFLVKEVGDVFLRGNFSKRPLKKYFYVLKYEFVRNPIGFVIFMTIILFIPFNIYNIIKKLIRKFKNEKLN